MILVDTGPIVALCDARDAKHRLSVTQLTALPREGLRACDAVLTEACFHLPHPSQRRRLQGLIRELDIQPVGLGTEASAWDDVFDWLVKYGDHQPDWADAWLAVLSGSDRRALLWTFDREFRTTWRRLDGSAIPVAFPGPARRQGL